MSEMIKKLSRRVKGLKHFTFSVSEFLAFLGTTRFNVLPFGDYDITGCLSVCCEWGWLGRCGVSVGWPRIPVYGGSL